MLSTPPQWRDLGEKLEKVHRELVLDSSDILVLQGERTKPPRTIGLFGLTAILPMGPSYLSCSLMALPGIRTQRPVSYEYHQPGGEPCVDGSFALGMTYSNRLVALASGGLSTVGPILTQLQDVSTKLPRDGKAYQNGLHDGIDWKQTLLRAWCSMMQRTLPGIVVEMEGKPTWLQSAENNRWLDRDIIINTHPGPISDEEIRRRQAHRRETLPRVYDRLAELVGAHLNVQTGNYQLPGEYDIPRVKIFDNESI